MTPNSIGSAPATTLQPSLEVQETATDLALREQALERAKGHGGKSGFSNDTSAKITEAQTAEARSLSKKFFERGEKASKAVKQVQKLASDNEVEQAAAAAKLAGMAQEAARIVKSPIGEKVAKALDSKHVMGARHGATAASGALGFVKAGNDTVESLKDGNIGEALQSVDEMREKGEEALKQAKKGVDLLKKNSSKTVEKGVEVAEKMALAAVSKLDAGAKLVAKAAAFTQSPIGRWIPGVGTVGAAISAGQAAVTLVRTPSFANAAKLIVNAAGLLPLPGAAKISQYGAMAIESDTVKSMASSAFNRMKANAEATSIAMAEQPVAMAM